MKFFFGGFIKGRIIKIESKDYYLIDERDNVYRCSLPGKFKYEFQLKKEKLYTLDIVAVGDEVEFEPVASEDGVGIILKVGDRRNYLSRKAPRIKGASYRGERLEQIIASNIDILFVVSSVSEPIFNNKVIDRILVAGESSRIETKIIINKTDLDNANKIHAWKNLYERIGYTTYLTSALRGDGCEVLRRDLQGRTSLLWGHSGVGKSTILNSLYPDLNLDTNEISKYSSKGKHTTVTSVMIKSDESTFIIDTPGVREIEPFGIKKEDLGFYFREFGDFIHDCRFNTCIHDHEPGCAIYAAVEEGIISGERYDSYLKLLNTIEEDLFL